CDINTGGCLYCSNAGSPFCVTISNALEDQYIYYCAPTRTLQVLNYRNLITSGSTAGLPNPTSATATTSSTTSTSTSTASSSSLTFPTSATDDGSSSSTTTDSSQPSDSTSSSTDPAATANSPLSNPLPAKHTVSGGAVAGIVTGTVLGASVVLLLCWFCLRTRFLHRRNPNTSNETNEKGANLIPGPELNSDHAVLDNPPMPQKPVEIEGSTPSTVQKPWSPSSLQQHPISPELDSSFVTKASSISPQSVEDRFRGVNNPANGLGIGEALRNSTRESDVPNYLSSWREPGQPSPTQSQQSTYRITNGAPSPSPVSPMPSIAATGRPEPKSLAEAPTDHPLAGSSSQTPSSRPSPISPTTPRYILQTAAGGPPPTIPGATPLPSYTITTPQIPASLTPGNGVYIPYTPQLHAPSGTYSPSAYNTTPASSLARSESVQYRGLSATGWGRTYLSPEVAMAGGYRDEGDAEEGEGKQDGNVFQV
ncbi:hypothetical protein LTR16_002846, partial [Cryomyces antarcticus]